MVLGKSLITKQKGRKKNKKLNLRCIYIIIIKMNIYFKTDKSNLCLKQVEVRLKPYVKLF